MIHSKTEHIASGIGFQTNQMLLNTNILSEFHPEINKSTKCNDVQQAGYCPHGLFCAFAHVECKYRSAAGEVRTVVCMWGLSLYDFRNPGNTIGISW